MPVSDDRFDFYVLQKTADLHEGHPCWEGSGDLLGKLRLAYSSAEQRWEIYGPRVFIVSTTTRAGLPFEADLAWRDPDRSWSCGCGTFYPDDKEPDVWLVGAMPVLSPGWTGRTAAQYTLLHAIEVAYEASGSIEPERVVILVRTGQSAYEGIVLMRSSKLHNGHACWEHDESGLLRDVTGHWSIHVYFLSLAITQRSVTSPIGTDVAWQTDVDAWGDVVAVLPWCNSGDVGPRVAAALRLQGEAAQPAPVLHEQLAALQAEDRGATQKAWVLLMELDGSFRLLVLEKGADLYEGRPYWKRGRTHLCYGGDKQAWEIWGFQESPVVAAAMPALLPFGTTLTWQPANPRGSMSKWFVGSMPRRSAPGWAQAATNAALLRAIEASCKQSWSKCVPARVMALMRQDLDHYYGEVLQKSPDLRNGHACWEASWLKLAHSASGRWTITGHWDDRIDVATLSSTWATPLGSDVGWHTQPATHTSEWEVVAVLPWSDTADAKAQLPAAFAQSLEAMSMPTVPVEPRRVADLEVPARAAENNSPRGERDSLAAELARVSNERDRLAAELAETREKVDSLYELLSSSRRSPGRTPLG